MALGLVLMGLMIRGGINDFKDKERIVSVKGLAEMEVPADKVIWPLAYKELGNDPVSIYNKIAEKNAAVVKYLKQNGVAEEEISIAPAEIIDMEADRYASQNVAYRYNATSVICPVVLSNVYVSAARLLPTHPDDTDTRPSDTLICLNSGLRLSTSS